MEGGKCLGTYINKVVVIKEEEEEVVVVEDPEVKKMEVNKPAMELKAKREEVLGQGCAAGLQKRKRASHSEHGEGGSKKPKDNI
eukprot:3233629-Rhodomonas_salina.1